MPSKFCSVHNTKCFPFTPDDFLSFKVLFAVIDHTQILKMSEMYNLVTVT